MRILFTCAPGMAHMHAMVPIVRAAADAGHEVAVATAPTFGARFAGSGVPVLPSGFDWSQSDPDSLPLYHQRRGPRLGAFAEVAAMGMVEDLLRHAEDYKPDLIAWDAMEFGGWVAAELLGLPQAAVASAMGTPRTIMNAMAGGELAELIGKYSLDPDPDLHRMFGNLYLHRKPSVLDLPYGERLARDFRFRPAMFDEQAPPRPDWLTEDERPLVHLSLGTTFVTSDAARTVHETVIAALADEPVRLVVAVGEHASADDYASTPANTQLVPYVDHRALLPHCAVFLAHGSFSSTLVSIASGVPMCFLPMGEDQPVTSMHLANLGLGVNLANVHRPPVPSLDAAALSADDVTRAVRTVLDSSSYADAVGYVRDEFRALPPVPAVVRRLEQLVDESA